LDHDAALAAIDRVVAWLLWLLFLLMMLSGYMLTKGFISRYWGFLAHLQLAIPTMAFFSVHFALRVRFILLKRKTKEELLVNLASVVAGGVLLLTVLYLGFFFRPG
jgi:uncharacterized membrane protein YbjE (DUF340 family)